MRTSKKLKWFKHDTKQKWNLSNNWHQQKLEKENTLRWHFWQNFRINQPLFTMFEQSLNFFIRLSNIITNLFSWYLSKSSRKWLNKVVKFYLSWNSFTPAVVVLPRVIPTNKSWTHFQQILSVFHTLGTIKLQWKIQNRIRNLFTKGY